MAIIWAHDNGQFRTCLIGIHLVARKPSIPEFAKDHLRWGRAAETITDHQVEVSKGSGGDERERLLGHSAALLFSCCQHATKCQVQIAIRVVWVSGCLEVDGADIR